MTPPFKVDPGIKETILKLAEKGNRSLSNYVVTLVMRHLEEQGIEWHKEGLKDENPRNNP